MNFKSRISLLNFVLLTLLLSAGAAFSTSQDDQQRNLTMHLTSGEDEQRFDAAAQLVALFNAYPNSAMPQTLSALIKALQGDSSPVVRALSARALENCCGEKAVPQLLASLPTEREIAVRKSILYALATHRSPQITSALLPLLRDKKQEIRAATAYALAEIGDASSSNALIDVLQRRHGDEDAFARSQAARGLGRIGNHAVTDVLLTSLVRDKSQEVRRELARALGLLAAKQDVKVVEALHLVTLQSDPYLTAIAGEALEKIRQRDF